MYSVRKTYLICVMIEDIFLLLFAALSPIYITPGYYWWTGLALFFAISGSHAFTKRVNQWGDLGIL